MWLAQATIAHTSPALFEIVNLYGTPSFDVASILRRTGRRALRSLYAPLDVVFTAVLTPLARR
ncbi:MAG: hypothetical protein M3137_01400 [Actinomycetota bacterium]|nr:hypothetical protein [Actinomycetota bacterium]